MDWFKAVDRPLMVGGLLDWFSPIVRLAKDISRRPVAGFVLPLDAVNPWLVKRLLKNEGIDYWGDCLYLNVFMFAVRRRDAQRVQAVLNRNRIPWQGG